MGGTGSRSVLGLEVLLEVVVSHKERVALGVGVVLGVEVALRVAVVLGVREVLRMGLRVELGVGMALGRGVVVRRWMGSMLPMEVRWYFEWE